MAHAERDADEGERKTGEAESAGTPRLGEIETRQREEDKDGNGQLDKSDGPGCQLREHLSRVEHDDPESPRRPASALRR